MKKITSHIGALLLLVFSSYSFAEIKIGVVDINRVLANSVQFKNMQAELKNKYAPRTQEIIDQQNVFLKDIEQYRKNNVNMKGMTLQKEQQKLVEENKKLQETQLGLQRDIFTARDEALRPILKQIDDIVQKIAAEQKFDLILTKASTAYNDPQNEITVQVIAEMGKLNK